MDGRRYSTYRVSGSVQKALWIAMGLATPGLVLQVLSDKEWDGGTKGWIILGIFAIVAVLVVWVYRAATVTSPESLAIRGLVRTRRIPWADVQAISIEINPGSFAQPGAPKRIVSVYDRTGKRRTLPHLNEKNNRYGSLDDEVAAIQAIWVRRRGRHWAPVAGGPGEGRSLATG